MNCFTNRHTSVVADKRIHASLLDGIQQSRARLKRFTHNDADSAYRLLAPIQSDKILVAESVYSMEGDIAPLDDLIKVAQTTQARLVIDDAHGFGIIGTNYGGIMDRKAINNEDVSIVITPFGKAIGGAGAMVTGKDEDIEILLQWARSYRYSTALPIPIVVALQSALQVWYHEKWRAEQLKVNIDRFLSLAHDFGIEPVSTSQTPIMSFIVGDNHRSCALQKLLLEEGLYVSCIRPPTVPEGTARLRITLTAFHTYDDLWQLVNTLAKHL
jgi:8-amino-7-oxononanoate synthase